MMGLSVSAHTQFRLLGCLACPGHIPGVCERERAWAPVQTSHTVKCISLLPGIVCSGSVVDMVCWLVARAFHHQGADVLDELQLSNSRVL